MSVLKAAELTYHIKNECKYSCSYVLSCRTGFCALFKGTRPDPSPEKSMSAASSGNLPPPLHSPLRLFPQQRSQHKTSGCYWIRENTIRKELWG